MIREILSFIEYKKKKNNRRNNRKERTKYIVLGIGPVHGLCLAKIFLGYNAKTCTVTVPPCEDIWCCDYFTVTML